VNELALFAGAGGGILGGKLLGWRTVCAVEWEPYPASVLLARQNDGSLPPFPIWDDVQTFDGNPWRGIVDVVSGGFPCQDISAAGKGAGIDGERSGMWGEMARVIREVRPRFVFVENSPMLTSRGLGRVLGDLASMGFDARWGVLGAADIGANHQRDRIWIVAKWRGQLSHAQHDRIRRWEQQSQSIEEKNANVAHSRYWRRWDKRIAERGQNPQGEWATDSSSFGRSSWWSTEPSIPRVADGVAARVERLKAIGNGQVPLCAATAWRILND
jgi:DNA (cytosine-5)-methyltransferase 1